MCSLYYYYDYYHGCRRHHHHHHHHHHHRSSSSSSVVKHFQTLLSLQPLLLFLLLILLILVVVSMNLVVIIKVHCFSLQQVIPILQHYHHHHHYQAYRLSSSFVPSSRLRTGNRNTLVPTTITTAATTTTTTTRINSRSSSTGTVQQQQQQQQIDVRTSTTPSKTIQSGNDENGDIVNVDDEKDIYHHENHIWMFRDIYPISYDRSRFFYHNNNNNNNSNNTDTTSTTPPTTSSCTTTTTTSATTTTTKILLLNGFGMGTFHQHRLMKEIRERYISSTNTNDHYKSSRMNPDSDGDTDDISTSNSIVEIYAIDYIGQGQSWPIHCRPKGTSNTEIGLQYSARTWMEQIISFIEQIILVSRDDNNNNNDDDNTNHENQYKVHIVGNSLGGYLATYIAAIRPDLIHTLILLNATPIWGFNILPGWDGYLPSPTIPNIIGTILFDIMRTTNTIQQFLNITYVNNPLLYHPTFISDIQSCTNHIGGHAAFTSILWSPPISINVPLSKQQHQDPSETTTTMTTTTTNFYDAIEQVQCSVLLCYGQQDPWCKPAFAKQILQRLQQKQRSKRNIIYVELSNVGHCPNHEAPVATAMVIQKWIQQKQKEVGMTNCNDSSSEQQQQQQMSFFGTNDKQQSMIIQETWGTTHVQERNLNEISLNWIDQIAVTML